MSEAKFAISWNFTTVRGDTYEEFLNNCEAIWPGEGRLIADAAMSDLRAHFLKDALPAVAAQTAANVLGVAPDAPQYVPATVVSVPAPPTVAPPAVVAAPPVAAAGGVPVCPTHGPKKYIAAGITKQGPKQGQPYAAFYTCDLPKGSPRCNL